MEPSNTSTNSPLCGKHHPVERIVKDYFHGLHHADITKLRNLFHPDAYLKAPSLRRTLDEWLKLVGEREVPALRRDPYGFEILSMDLMHEQAMVKVLCPLLGRIYVDFLGLLKENGRWLIVNKMYADQ